MLTKNRGRNRIATSSVPGTRTAKDSAGPVEDRKQPSHARAVHPSRVFFCQAVVLKEFTSRFRIMTPISRRQQAIAQPADVSPAVDMPTARGNGEVAAQAQMGRQIVPRRIEQALVMLLESYDYAQDVACPIWEFAVELDAFHAFGLTPGDWRWLCLKGLVDHGRERTMSDERARSFRQGGVLRLSRRTCFVLTEAGERFARQLVVESGPRVRTNWDPAVMPAQACLAGDLLDLSQLVPTWDRDRQQLRVGKFIVKEFKLPAPNQETILAAFQEENWAPRIDDPLPPLGDIDPKRRLHDTITSLNRNQKKPLIRFLGDGSGEGVRWEGVAQPHENGRH